MSLWTAGEAADATGGRAHGDWRADGVAIDSRSVVPGDLFIAVVGPRHDGHEFVGEAMDAGAAAAVVSRPADGGIPQLQVADTREALLRLAEAARARTGARIAAVTGSVGKTGSKEALARLLTRSGPVHASRGNLNNEWGAPLSLARMPAGSAFGVMELGMNHPGEILPLSRLVRPHVALVTAIARPIRRSSRTWPGSPTPRPRSSRAGARRHRRDQRRHAHADRLAQAAGGRAIRRFSRRDRSADAVLVSERLDAEGSDVEVDLRGRRLAFRIGAPGAHWVGNALGVLLAADALGAEPDPEAFAGVRAPAGRGARHCLGGIRVIDESYNASPAAMRAAFAVLGLHRPDPGGRRIAVLGDMLELGGDSDSVHGELAAPLQQAGVDRVFATGPGMRHLFDRLPACIRGGYMNDSGCLAPLVAESVTPGDIVLVKGSLGMGMRRIIDAIERRTAGSGGESCSTIS